MIQNQYTRQFMPQNYANQMQQMAPSFQPMNPPMMGQTMSGMMGGALSPSGGQLTPPVMNAAPSTMDASSILGQYQQPFQQSFQPMAGQPMGGMKGGSMPQRRLPQPMGGTKGGSMPQRQIPQPMGGMKGGAIPQGQLPQPMGEPAPNQLGATLPPGISNAPMYNFYGGGP